MRPQQATFHVKQLSKVVQETCPKQLTWRPRQIQARSRRWPERWPEMLVAGFR